MRISLDVRRLGSLAPLGVAVLLLCGLTSIHRRGFAVGGKAVYAATPAARMETPDAVCRGCHEQIYDAYRQTPMARGSGAATDGLDATLLAAKPLLHRSSGVTYRVSVRSGQAFLAFDRPAAVGAGELHGERRLDYFVGSGKRGRTYLYQQEGLWFEAPINWYGKQQLWDMAPAYDNATAMPDTLPVDPNCLHCHTGEPQPALGPARNRYAGPPFRASGVGCSACHGDPSEHLAQAAAHRSGGSLPHPAILNPDKLSPTRRDSVCLQCHLEGDATVYRAGKSLAAFRPGDDLSAFAVYFVDQSRAQLGGRASSQYEALLRSACRRGAGDRLTCTTCHDPHSSPAPAERVAFFRAKCLACHTGPQMAVQHHQEQQDCAVCHMPTRKTRDISHEQLTDHDIEAHPKPATAEPSPLRSPELTAVGGVAATDRELGLAYAQFAERGDRVAGARSLALLQAAEKAGANDHDLHDRLGFLLQVSGSPLAAASQYAASLRDEPHDTAAAANLAVLEAGRGHPDEAIRLLTQVVQDDPSQTAAGLNLAFLECRAGRQPEALRTVRRMLLFNPDSPVARRFLATGDYGNQRCILTGPGTQ